LRVIAGALKGRRLEAPAGRDVRPTSDRAREALFSILAGWPMGAFLDLFSGSGAVALEALSRGYSPVWCVERDRGALAAIRANARGAALDIVAKDAREVGEGSFSGVSVVFADPPYGMGAEMWGALAGRLRTFLAPGGVLVWECHRDSGLTSAEGLERVDERRYGRSKFLFFEAQTPSPAIAEADRGSN
jgi:16S rRNA (guanine966-N2)-methyltransferase